MEHQSKRAVETFIAWAYLPVFGIALLAFYLFTYSAQSDLQHKAQVLTAQTAQLHANAIASCKRGNLTRQEINRHERAPLKQVSLELAAILHQASAQQKAAGKSTRKIDALAAKFEGYAATVVPLSLINCTQATKVPR